MASATPWMIRLRAMELQSRWGWRERERDYDKEGRKEGRKEEDWKREVKGKSWYLTSTRVR